jgi:hypothetical protein
VRRVGQHIGEGRNRDLDLTPDSCRRLGAHCGGVRPAEQGSRARGKKKGGMGIDAIDELTIEKGATSVQSQARVAGKYFPRGLYLIFFFIQGQNMFARNAGKLKHKVPRNGEYN